METISGALKLKQRVTGGLAKPYVEVWKAGDRVATLDIISGSVSYDRTTAVFRSLSCTVAGFDAIIPDAGALQPAGTFSDTSGTFGDGPFGDNVRQQIRSLIVPEVSELRAYVQVTMNDGSLETVSLGRYVSGKASYTANAAGVLVTLTGYDLFDPLSRAGYDDVVSLDQSTNVRTAFVSLVTDRLPGATVIAPTTPWATARMALLPVNGCNPRADLDRIAALAGWVTRTTRLGAIEAFPPPSISGGTSVHSLDEATLIETGTVWDGFAAVNTVVVDGMTSENVPVRASWSYNGGQWGRDKIGPRTKYVTLEGPISYDQALSMAKALLPAYTGIVDTVSVRIPPTLHIDPWDLVDITDSELQLEDTLYLVDRVDIDLDFTAANPTTLRLSRRLA